jgi:hypothetical protein
MAGAWAYGGDMVGELGQQDERGGEDTESESWRGDVGHKEAAPLTRSA